MEGTQANMWILMVTALGKKRENGMSCKEWSSTAQKAPGQKAGEIILEMCALLLTPEVYDTMVYSQQA